MIPRRSFAGLSLASRANRRQVITAWWLVLVFVFVSAARIVQSHSDWSRSPLFGWSFFLLLFVLHSVGRSLWGPLSDPGPVSTLLRVLAQLTGRPLPHPEPPTDRELILRMRAKNDAYDGLVMAALLLFIAHILHMFPVQTPMRELLWLFAFLYLLNLPDSIYLWRLPDREES